MEGTLRNPVATMKRVLRSVGRDESRHALTHVHLEGGNAVSTDSFRLTVVGDVWSGPALDVPSEVAREIAKCKAGETAKFRVDGDALEVEMEDGTVVEGKVGHVNYPKWEGLLPKECNALVYVGRDELLAKVREVVKLKVGILEVSVSKGDFTVNHTWFESASVEGGDMVIGFDPVYVRDALLSIESDVVRIALTAPMKPAVLSCEMQDGTSVLVMPVRLERGTGKKKGMRKAPKRPEKEPTGERVELKGECVCITGTLPMARSEAFTRLKLAGGTPSENFTRKTTMLVIAENSGKGKREKAEKAIERGQQVKVVSGTDFVAALMEKGTTEREMAEKVETAAKDKGADVKATVKEDADVTAVVMEPKKEDMVEELNKRIAELEAELAKAKAPKAEKPKAEKPKAPNPPKKVETAAIEISLEFMQEWCEGKNVVATQKNPERMDCIWVKGDSKPYEEELKGMGFRWAKKKGWYFDPKRAA